MSTAVKICGILAEEALDAAIEAGADYAGFVFFPRSPRNISLNLAKTLARRAEGRIATVALTVDADDRTIEAIAGEVGPDFLQLHGNEMLERAAALRQKHRVRVIKAVKVGEARDVKAALAFEDAVDIVLFDAKPPATANALPGGNGFIFDWSMLAGASLRADFMLSGGLNSGNVLKALQISGARAVDVSSGVETSPGVKSPPLIKEFIQTAKSFPEHHKEKNNAARL